MSIKAAAIPKPRSGDGAAAIAAAIARRAALIAQLPAGAVAVLPTAPEVRRNGNSDYPYRHDSNFYYLTAFAEPESVLVLMAPGPQGPARAILFCREKNNARAIWDGHRLGPDAAREQLGFDAAYPIEELDARMSELLRKACSVYQAEGQSEAFDAQVKLWLHNAGRDKDAGGKPAAPVCDIRELLAELRLIKDGGEQALMRRAAIISAHAHMRAMACTRPGMREYEIEAELLYEFRRHGAQCPAYTPIVAAGANSCVLHYIANNGLAADGELVLIDAGCELDGYAADISRTYPVNGRFSAPQAMLYELVRAAQAAALAVVRPGLPYQKIHAAALQVLAQGMLDTGLLDNNRVGGVEDIIADRSYLPFYMHGTGHWLGMDVHDTGNYLDAAAPGQPSRALQPGMVLTVEPGIYVRPARDVPEQFWNIGIRIEDDVLVTPGGHQVLSDSAPKTIAAIEQLMRQKAWKP
jgi:Xaa-Pro aminopeptidase